MRVHHLVAGRTAPPGMASFICHVLLVEHPDGLTLVDSGFGRADIAYPTRLGPLRHVLRPVAGATAADAVEEAGFAVDDVAHIVLTHLDLDHVGGAVDFPQATWHTTADEWSAATTARRLVDRPRYRTAQLRGSREVRAYAGIGDLWRHGLSAHEVLGGVSIIPMPGHSLGHAAVAVQSDRGLIVHAGDAVFDASCYGAADARGKKLRMKPELRAFELTVARDRLRLRRNHAALAALHADPETTVVNAHDDRVFPG
ncbi:MAG: MBL fold metallo-hydrolase [Aeromicrobium sp.]|uniref:MBL fold metallo-hydrolase n=1 Tax=Aeromicrobium sp. TaxID=1871063 RepID=UPI0039E6B0FC